MSTLDEFRHKITTELWPEFRDSESRQFSDEGFRPNWSAVSEFDAAHFLTTFRSGALRHLKNGTYKAALSGACEQLFWQGQKNISPRPVFLWIEPIITIATLGRLHTEFNWPVHLLGTQTHRWEFDLAAFRHVDDKVEYIACEVKKTKTEVDNLIAYLKNFAEQDTCSEVGLHKHQLNAYRKFRALRERRPRLLWVVGPAGYGQVFEPFYDNGIALIESTLNRICYPD